MKLYSRQYERPEVPSDKEEPKMTSAEAEKVINFLYKELNYRPLPEREERLKDVLKFVKGFAERYAIDIDIIQEEIDIQVRLYCNYLGWDGSIKDDLGVLIDLCNEMNIEMDKHRKYNCIIMLRFFTHAMHRKDRRVFPVR